MATIDQTYDTANQNSAAIINDAGGSQQELGQGFTPTVTAPVPYIDIYIQKVGSPTGNISLEIRNDTAGAPGSTIHATSTAIDVSTLSTSLTKVRFTFPTPYTVTSGTLYHMTTTVTYSASDTNTVQWGCDTTSPSYSGGSYSSKSGGSWSANTGIDNCFDQYYTPEEGGFIFFSS